MAAKNKPCANQPHWGRSQSRTKREKRRSRTGAPAASGIVVLAGFRIEQAVSVQDEIAHLRVIDRSLRRALPGVIGRLVVREGADEVDCLEVRELELVNVLQLAADDEVKQLLFRR